MYCLYCLCLLLFEVSLDKTMKPRGGQLFPSDPFRFLFTRSLLISNSQGPRSRAQPALKLSQLWKCYVILSSYPLTQQHIHCSLVFTHNLQLLHKIVICSMIYELNFYANCSP